MNMKMRKLITLMTAALTVGAAASTPSASQPASLNGIESAYADFNDALGAISLIESGLRDSYEGKTRDEWARLQQQARENVQQGLKELAGHDLLPADRRAIEIMRQSMADAD